MYDHLFGTAIDNRRLNRMSDRPGARPCRLKCLHNIHAIRDLPEHNMLPIEPTRDDGRDEEL